MNYAVWSDLIYLALSVAVTLLVGWTLHRNGRTVHYWRPDLDAYVTGEIPR